MQGYGRQRVMPPLFAVGLSLVLIIASVIGAFAHAAHGAHHQGHGAHVGVESAAEFGGDFKKGHGPDHSETKAGHALCGDFFCHGGFAIVGQQGIRDRVSEPSCITLRPRDDIVAGNDGSSLDRPPRDSILL